MPLPLDDPDWRLRWPRDLFVDELKEVQTRPAIELLFEEAFSGSGPVDLIRRRGDGWSRELLAHQMSYSAARELLERRSELAEERRAPYRSTRLAQVRAPHPPSADWERAKREFIDLFEELDSRGYFDRAWGKDCVDNPRPQGRVQDAFTRALGLEHVHPFHPAAWSQDEFLSIIEVVHDHAARPRVVDHVHDFSNCGRHYDSYTAKTGHAVFRFRVQRIFAGCNIPFRIADSGEDYGRVVAMSDEAREDLLVRAPGDGRPTERDEIGHAIALFRSRAVTREDKRSAVNTLVRILETHRKTLKSALLKKDEGALFQIANEFDVRHRNESQKSDYDDAFLDWIFWWYLSTIELLRHMGERKPEHPTRGRKDDSR